MYIYSIFLNNMSPAQDSNAYLPINIYNHNIVATVL